MSISVIKKRDGRIVPFDIKKIADAIEKSFRAWGTGQDTAEISTSLAWEVCTILELEGNPAPTVEHVQDLVEKVLMRRGYEQTAKRYILYRQQRTDARNRKEGALSDALYECYGKNGVSPAVYRFGEKLLDSLRLRFENLDRIAELNQGKVLRAMQKNRVDAPCFAATTGYGYDDVGRERLEKVYADVFGAEAALVRPQLVCGTHALAVALSANLLPGNELLSPVGAPYDTLQEVIGIRPAACSLKEYGVSYRQVELLPDGGFDLEGIRAALNKKTKMVTIQRSRGYSTRPSLPVDRIAELIAFIKSVKPDVIVMVDNCYGEFVETKEPSEFGADLCVGSLIKNPGGGLAPIGGYVVGKKEYVDRCAYRLSAPGLGQEVGANLGILPRFYQGLFLAPTVTVGALKGAIFAAYCFEKLGFKVHPSGTETRTDLIQAVELGGEAGMRAFCRGIQSAAPVDSYVEPIPWQMPGYDCPVIMAAGAFVQGSSIELSADGPIRPPYAVYFQGGLTWHHAKLGILKSIQSLQDAGLVEIED